ARQQREDAALGLRVDRLVPGRDLAQVAAFDPDPFDAEKLSALVAHIALGVTGPAAHLVEPDQVGLEVDLIALVLAPGQQRRRILRLDCARPGDAFTKPVEMCALGHQMTSFSTSITVSTSSSFRCGYIGSEKIRRALRSVTGN